MRARSRVFRGKRALCNIRERHLVRWAFDRYEQFYYREERARESSLLGYSLFPLDFSVVFFTGGPSVYITC